MWWWMLQVDGHWPVLARIRFRCYRVALPSCLATRASNRRSLARACRYWAWKGSRCPSMASSEATEEADVDVDPLRSMSEPRSRMDRRSCRFSSRTWRNCSTSWFLKRHQIVSVQQSTRVLRFMILTEVVRGGSLRCSKRSSASSKWWDLYSARPRLARLRWLARFR